MKARQMLAILVWVLVLVVCQGTMSGAAPMGTAFTYQGRLMDADTPADGLYDLQFKLFDDPNVILGNEVGSTIDMNEFDVIDGYFTVDLDFVNGDPNVFNGAARWLEIGIREGGLEDPNEYMILLPRQEVRPTPYALYAASGTPGPPGSEGPEGQQGEQGLEGSQGPQGEDGADGATGATGATGDQGLPGEDGADGATGATGATGDQGLPGEDGADGATGATGATGPPGDSHWTLSGSSTYYNAGKVGIGTSSPQQNLSVWEGMNIDQSNSNDGSISPSLRFGSGSSGEVIASKRTSGGNQYGLDFYTAGLNRMSIIRSGNVGIGTTNPDDLLHVWRDTGGSLGIMITNADVQGRAYSLRVGGSDSAVGAGNFAIYDHNESATRLVVDSTGNVGIGTTDPVSKLEVKGRLELPGNDASGTAGTGAIEIGNSLRLDDNEIITNTDQTLHIQRDNNGDLSVDSGTLTVDASANRVGIGTTKPQQNLSVWEGMNIDQSNSNDGSISPGLRFGSGSSGEGIVSKRTSGGNQYGLDFYTGVANRMSITSSGNVGIGTTDPLSKLSVGGDGLASAAVYGEGSGSGVFGKSSHTGVYGSGDTYGVYGRAPVSSGWGVYGRCTESSGRGVVGRGDAYDFYAYGHGVNYGPFTGAHEAKLCDDFPQDVEPGMIVSVTGQTQVRYDDESKVSISSTLPTVRLSDAADDKAVFGVFVAETPLIQDHWYEADQTERFATVNALGEGRVWVCNINGEIEAGDYITTSTVPGYGQRQDDDLLHSYTLGKSIETVDWDSVTEMVEFNGQTYKVYLIAVVYTSG